MIKIQHNDLEDIKDDFYTGIHKLVTDRIDFYSLAFQVINGSIQVKELSKQVTNIGLKKKTALLKLLFIDPSDLTKKAHYSNLTQSAKIKKIYIANTQNYIDLFSLLKKGDTLKSIILSEPDKLKNQEKKIIPSWDSLENIRKLFENIFDYDTFCNKAETKYYNAYQLAEALQVNVCPYCNRSYISTIIENKNRKIIRPSFDHFFAKAKHPALAVSFYNLIPSCSNCNYYLKGKTEFDLDKYLHPYMDGFGKDAYFDFSFKGLHKDKSHPSNFEISLNIKPSTTAKKKRQLQGIKPTDKEGSVKIFKLQEIYQAHTDIVGEIYEKLDEKSPFYAQSIFKFIEALNSSKADFYKFYFNNYINELDFNKRPLSKLTKDIVSKYLPEIISK
ncbi:hypothetical protein [Flavobacterium chilense]|uniref:HNH endonuclease n=1 Tax=Flavobacterium chilense TaxID=946677 RepID=A0A1M6XEN5_9FLAO|nr:hypothetical protein [Flavobacterium chilense]SHL04454.1 hypothetical protein SAMN05444484_101111 [Flavobacterium chilense]